MESWRWSAASAAGHPPAALHPGTLEQLPAERFACGDRMEAADHPASVPGRVLSRHELVNRVRGCGYDGYERTIDSRIRGLRHKIETGPHVLALIETVTGHRLAVTRDHEPGMPPPARPRRGPRKQADGRSGTADPHDGRHELRRRPEATRR